MKLEIPLLVPDQNLSLEACAASGKQGDEVLFDEERQFCRVQSSAATQSDGGLAYSSPSKPVTFDAEAMSLLTGMGFPEIRCQRALLTTGNQSGEAAMEWLFSHLEDPGLFDS